jgi:hypothetical protein
MGDGTTRYALPQWGHGRRAMETIHKEWKRYAKFYAPQWATTPP